MPHTDLSDEQILILRVASLNASAPRDREVVPQYLADLELLKELGYVTVYWHDVTLTAAGAGVLAGIDAAWERNDRRRNPRLVPLR